MLLGERIIEEKSGGTTPPCVREIIRRQNEKLRKERERQKAEHVAAQGLRTS